MFYFIYDILVFLAALIYLPFYAFRGRVHKDILMRLGFFRKDYFQAVGGKDIVCIHAVSVGEARSAESLLRLIRRQWPQKSIVVSTVTPTGQAIAKTLLKENEMAFYAPLDISFVVEKFLRSLTALSLLIIMETELWPNLIRLSKKKGAKVVVVNGRISDRSFTRYNRFKYLLKKVLGGVDLFCMQNEEAQARIVRLGAAPEKVKRTGNIKFDISTDLKESSLVAAFKEIPAQNLIFLAGSTHDQEEEIIVEIYKSIKKDFPHLRLWLAPRHIERADKIRRMIKGSGLEAVYFSGLYRQKKISPLSPVQVLIVDTVGDLSSLYRLCDIAFVGGSLVKKGGHNPIEPALFGKAVIFGKHMDNFREVRDVFLKEEAALEVESGAGLEYGIRELLAHPSQRQVLGERAKALLDKNKGAAERTFAAVREVLAS